MALTKVDISMLEDAGATGQVLTSDGTNWTSVAAAAGGAWTVVNSANANNIAALIVSGMDATYETYCLMCSGIRPSYSNADCRLRIGDSSGIKTDSHYMRRATYGHSSNSTVSIEPNADSDKWYIWSGAHLGNASGYGASAQIFIHTPRTESSPTSLSFPMIWGYCINRAPNGYLYHETLGGSYKSDINATQLQISPSQGTLTTGRATLYGIAHA